MLEKKCYCCKTNSNIEIRFFDIIKEYFIYIYTYNSFYIYFSIESFHGILLFLVKNGLLNIQKILFRTIILSPKLKFFFALNI